jgi:D-alanine-D-alanine ligase-like ATP-grasp enzyme
VQSLKGEQMNTNSLLYYKTACALKLPTSLLENIDGFDITLGKQRYFFRGGNTPYNFGSSLEIADNKYCMNSLLKSAGFPVPNALAFEKSDFGSGLFASLIQTLHFPLVAKPMMGTSSGKDVLCNIPNITQLKAYMNKCFKKHEYITIEEYHGGLSSYRVLVFYNKVIGVVQRFPATVTGDGTHSIKELIAIDNVEREKLIDAIPLGPIRIDEETTIRLTELNMTLDTIPNDKETIVLCYSCNSTRGGTMKSLRKKICKENARLFCKAATVLGLNIVGFDVQCEDIQIPIAQSRGVIIEANYNPDISIHEAPLFGIPTKVSLPILSRLIFKHPLAYCLGVCQKMKNNLYLKVTLVVFVFLLAKLLLT